MCRNIFEALELAKERAALLTTSKDVDELVTWEPRGDGPPTKYPPGTREKLKVLMWRARHGLHLFHPLDAANYHGSPLKPTHYRAYPNRLGINKYPTY